MTAATDRKRFADELRLERAGRERAEELLVKQVLFSAVNCNGSFVSVGSMRHNVPRLFLQNGGQGFKADHPCFDYCSLLA